MISLAQLNFHLWASGSDCPTIALCSKLLKAKSSGIRSILYLLDKGESRIPLQKSHGPLGHLIPVSYTSGSLDNLIWEEWKNDRQEAPFCRAQPSEINLINCEPASFLFLNTSTGCLISWQVGVTTGRSLNKNYA